jgi:hypothetical protein
MVVFPTADFRGGPTELPRLGRAEFDPSNRAFLLLMLKLSLVAIAFTSAGLGLLALV